jgi:hypothetical protein
MVTLEVRYCKQGYCSRGFIVVDHPVASLELQKWPARAGGRRGEGDGKNRAKKGLRDARELRGQAAMLLAVSEPGIGSVGKTSTLPWKAWSEVQSVHLTHTLINQASALTAESAPVVALKVEIPEFPPN